MVEFGCQELTVDKLFLFFRNHLGGKLVGMPPPNMLPPVGTPEEIQQRLNTDPATRAAAPWIIADDISALTLVTLVPELSFNSTRGLIVKAFISATTAEVKIFLTKILDVPGRENLWR